MEERVTFQSAKLKINGTLHLPPGARPGERRPAFMVLHGFGSNSSSSNCVLPCQMLAEWGYAALRFDFRGCGESEGKRANTICLEQVEDTSAALTFLQTRAEIDPARIAAVGSSFGAAVAVYTGGVDNRVAAVISSGGWGDGESKFRRQHSSDEAWKRFTDMMARGKAERARGQSMMVPRYDIVPIPEHLRTHLAKNSIMEFTFETVESMFNFRANEVVGKIAPRPLLLLHSSNDSVTPTEQSIGLFQHAGKSTTELHLLTDVDHFMFSQENTRVIALIRDWLDKYFPAKPR
ncbi:MAG TPA: alpha/beta fold hydrolase [Stellaceae bacterium]|nr:alpha/beta fold hydrolase [Stellaceae bacterium]